MSLIRIELCDGDAPRRIEPIVRSAFVRAGAAKASQAFIDASGRMPTFVAWVTDHGVDRDVGFVTIERQTEFSAEVRCVAVHRDFGGRGIGTRLLSHAEYRLAGSGVRSVSVKLPAFSKPDAEHTRTLHFFESRGYARREEANARVPDATYLTLVKVINPGDAETGA